GLPCRIPFCQIESLIIFWQRQANRFSLFLYGCTVFIFTERTPIIPDVHQQDGEKNHCRYEIGERTSTARVHDNLWSQSQQYSRSQTDAAHQCDQGAYSKCDALYAL